MNIIELLMQYSSLVIIALLVATVILMFVLVVKRPVQATAQPLTVDTMSLNEAVKQIRQEVHHAASVSAALKLIEQLDEHPDALELIKQYPRSVQAAAMMQSTSTLGSSLQTAQTRLQAAHDYKATGYSHAYKLQLIAEAQQIVDMVSAKLDAAVAASAKLNPHNVN
jgi:hypothetical protein